MASLGIWTVIFDDKGVVKNNGSESGTGYKIDDDDFWNQSKFSNIWAIQYNNSIVTDQVEYRDETPNSSYADADLGDFQEFITRWDSAHLSSLQSVWDNDNINDETESEKITRLGARPTSYSS